MKNNIKLLLITVFCAAILLPGYLLKNTLFNGKKTQLTFQLPKIEGNQEDSRKQYQNWLIEHDNKLWREIETIYNITKEKANELKIEWKKEYKTIVNELETDTKSTQPISEENKKLVHEILNDYKLDPQTISIISWTHSSPGGSTDTTVFINEDEMKYMPLEAKKFVIAHEIGHIIHKDHSTDFIITKLRMMNPKQDESEFNQFMQKYAEFKELRADITAMLQNDEYIKGQCVYFNHHVQCALAAGDKDQDKDPRYIAGKQFKETLLC